MADEPTATAPSTVGHFARRFLAARKRHDARAARLRSKVTALRAEIARIEAELQAPGPDWFEHLVKPLAELIAHRMGRQMKIVRYSERTVDVRLAEVPDGDVKCIWFTPGDPERGEIEIVSHELGSCIPVPREADVDWLVRWVR